MSTASAEAAVPAGNGDPRDRFLPVEGGQLRYRDEGRGPVLLLVHGWTLDLDMWDPQAADLCGELRIVRFDRRGFGLSAGQPALANDVADIDALCRHLGLRELAVLGMSQGARVVLAWAARAGTQVQCIVLDGPPELDGPATDEADVPLQRLRTMLREQGIAAMRREWAAHPLVQLRTRDPRARQLLATMIGRYPGSDLRAEPQGTAASAGPVPAASTTAPTLVISGEHDLAGRVTAAAALARRLPRAEHALIPGAGHLPNLDNPGAYNRRVAAFLERHRTTSS